jgi:hypothetical protein
MLPLPRLGWYNLSIEAEKAIKALGINRTMLRQLHWRFDDIDTGGQGQITKVCRRVCVSECVCVLTTKLLSLS